MNKRWPFKVGEVKALLLRDKTPYVAVVRDNRTGEERAVGIIMDDSDPSWCTFCRVSEQLSLPSGKSSWLNWRLCRNEYTTVRELLKSIPCRADSEEYEMLWLKYPMTLEELRKLRKLRGTKKK